MAEGVKLRREVDARKLRPLPLERSYDVVALNYDYFDLDFDEAQAGEVVNEEADLIDRIERAGNDGHAMAAALLDERYERDDDAAALDLGMAGIVATLTAKGAMTITSCNGGVLGPPHSYPAPTVLFACPASMLPAVDAAADAVGCGLVVSDGFLELFADDLRKMNAIARMLLDTGIHNRAAIGMSRSEFDGRSAGSPN